MTHKEIVERLQKDYLGSHWVLNGDTYDGLTWLDDPSTKPTAEDLGL